LIGVSPAGVGLDLAQDRPSRAGQTAAHRDGGTGMVRAGNAGFVRRRWIAGAALALAAQLSGCALLPTAPVRAGAGAAPDLAAALQRGLPYAVGVYAIGSTAAPTARLAAADRPAAPSEGDADEGPGASVGAGIVLGADGRVVTAAHVVAEAEAVIVKLADARILPARVVGVDTDADIAVLRIDARWPAEPPLGHSVSLRPGDRVLAIGEPFGLSRSAVAGIVSGDARHFVDDRDVMFLQTDIALNPGDSGGPLLDEHGRIVAMNLRSVVGLYGMAGLGLSVPIEVVQQIAAEIESGRTRARPQLGARFEDLAPPEAYRRGMTHARGALVRSVSPAGAAQRLGLRAGDVIVGMNGRPVSDGADLGRLLLEWDDAAELRLTVFRAGGYAELRAR
jgi:serine protease Do